ncbi:MAG: hypothetical protein ABS52_16095 [Gemmatimonadetes bacterium SCN 70-22]|nr:MAG: hypothetical protein ABS52_16095 [Gemmatimonadetes bacterium SCN 70-22]
MPTLDWIGKRAVLNHHREIPFHLLKQDAEISAGDTSAGNLLLEGDMKWLRFYIQPSGAG